MMKIERLWVMAAALLLMAQGAWSHLLLIKKINNMKKMMMIAVMAVACLTANAQNGEGGMTLQPKVGINFANNTSSGCDMKVGLLAGAEFEYGLTSNIGLGVGLLYSMEGFKSGDVKYNFDYVNIPIVLNYYVTKGLALKAGLQPAFNTRHEATNGDVSIDIDKVAGLVGSKVNSFNLSIPVGLSYEYEKFVFDFRYHIGVSKTFENDTQGRNSTFSLTIGYKIDL